jgi:class 3 adenylate cyclase
LKYAVEQLTKTIGDAILLTQPTVDALTDRPSELLYRGTHALNGESAATQIYGLVAERY